MSWRQGDAGITGHGIIETVYSYSIFSQGAADQRLRCEGSAKPSDSLNWYDSDIYCYENASVFSHRLNCLIARRGYVPDGLSEGPWLQV